MNQELEKFRYKQGQWGSSTGDNFGLFFVKVYPIKAPLKVICSPLGEMEWDHVSVSLPNRCPTWTEMSKVKDLFFGEDVTVIQFHPKKSEYVNNHPYCLHLWRNIKNETELPPSILTGIKNSDPILTGPQSDN